MSRPFFSIIIPTRSRSDLVHVAIESVLAQTFTDWELIISDSDPTEQTSNVIKRYEDTRIRHFRSGDLSMADNWEFGLEKTTGQYVTVLQDKAALLPDALAIIHKACLDFNVPIVSWNYSFVHKEKNPEKILEQRDYTRWTYSAEEVLQLFVCHGDYNFSRVTPRFINSCCERSIIEKAKRTSVGRVFPPYSPDYTSMYIQLYLYDELAYIDRPLMLIDNRKYSSGAALAAKAKDTQEYKTAERTLMLGDERHLCDRMPVNAPHISYNHMMNEYVRMRELLGGRLTYYPVDLISYYNQCYHFIELSEELGADMTEERQRVDLSLAQQCGNVKRGVRDLRNRHEAARKAGMIK